ncbi:aspartate-alanine antiporter [Trinickia caryophylli]|uniref:Putative transport protein n=1 Tax=Trinickia caryophylli TaxID=28094 RepID=A0A1X7FMG5_TRICW|nr:aspartate-alanine antiporter [Trinickia caryophylli]PMS13839.1 aspartate-alanine antiporter [Trinickia caryophylli]TRX14334.1 aspartate-alanine antiporter [Trinickia caryophylli]WQE14167.1 aspartate-alanine antiporter [Trinickia caryophylli]SMF55062.1 putative transport protein [Trinickia caryophylli]GLU33333.1 putative transporter [Trinickia caryophylli]
MDYFVHTLQKYPEIALFLTIGIGFWIGNLKLGRFNLGIVTSTLLAGLLVGQIGIKLPSALQSTFFAMFLFAVGYSVGPQFIRALKNDGLPQVLFAVIVCLSGTATAIVLGKLLGYNGALTAGLLSGGYTNSTVLGVATDLVQQSGLSDAQLQSALALLPIAYAVTYPFGTIGSAYLLANIAPKLLKFDLAKECAQYEREHGGGAAIGTTAYREYSARAFRLMNPSLIGKTVRDIESFFNHEIFVRRMRLADGADIVDCTRDTTVSEGAILAVSGGLASLLQHERAFGPEVKDVPLLDFPTELLDIVVTSKQFAGKTLGEIKDALFGEPGRGVFLTKVTRSDGMIAVQRDMKIQRGDVLQILGARQDVAKIAKVLGYADRPIEGTDMAFMAFGIVAGSLIGAITVHIGGIPLSLGTAVGAIVAGIICGYLRSTMRTFGHIPGPAIWVFNNVGLNGFIACIGLNAALGFVGGIQHYGLTLFLAGTLVTIVPLIVGLLLGHFVFKFHPGIMLGACAGARSTTAALGALQEAAKSNVPVVGYATGYAVSRLVMALLTIVVIRMF